MARRRRRGGGLAFLLALILLLGAGWAAYWYGASEVAARGLARAEARDLTCADREIAGFPLSVTVSCSTVTLRDARSGVEARMHGFDADAALYWPGKLTGRAERIEIALPGGRAVPPMQGEGDLTLFGLTSAIDTNIENALRLWVENGGGADIERVRLAASGFVAVGRGRLAFTRDGRLNGVLTLHLSGLSALPDLVGAVLPGRRDEAETMARALATFTRPVDTPDGPAQEVLLGFREGVVLAGGFLPIGVVPAFQP